LNGARQQYSSRTEQTAAAQKKIAHQGTAGGAQEAKKKDEKE